MGCKGLLGMPWSLKDEAMVWEVIKGALNQFDNILKCDPSQWTVEKWREVYKFRAGRSGYASQKDEYA